MWIPGNGAEDDRHHLIYFKCSYCKGQKRACQFFGHYSDLYCDAPSLQTVYDKPICSLAECQGSDFMRPTHSLTQIFCDENFDWHYVFFETVEQAELFFTHYPAQECLDDNIIWLRFLSVSQFHRSLELSGCFVPTNIVVTEIKAASGVKKLIYNAGTLSNIV